MADDVKDDKKIAAAKISDGIKNASTKDEKQTANKSKKKAKKEKPVKEKKPNEIRKVVLDPNVVPFETLRFVLMTEKCVRLIEAQNKLVFIVRRTSRKVAIKKAVENAFQSPVNEITTFIDQRGRKRAFVKFATDGAAGDIAIRLGIL